MVDVIHACIAGTPRHLRRVATARAARTVDTSTFKATVNRISEAARPFRERVEDPAQFLATCDGGDPGTPAQPAIWLFGIEPGWSLADQAADKAGSPADTDHLDQLDRYAVELQLKWTYNRNAFRLLAALAGEAPERYRAFALRVRPFEKGSLGYFKGNLFPEPFYNVGEWDDAARELTGFQTKSEYQAWLRLTRFGVIRAWIERSRPRLVIGTGLTFLADFLAITGNSTAPEAFHFEVNGHLKRMFVATTGTVPVAVVPHLSGGPHGLNSNRAIQLAAARILHELD